MAAARLISGDLPLGAVLGWEVGRLATVAGANETDPHPVTLGEPWRLFPFAFDHTRPRSKRTIHDGHAAFHTRSRTKRGPATLATQRPLAPVLKVGADPRARPSGARVVPTCVWQPRRSTASGPAHGAASSRSRSRPPRCSRPCGGSGGSRPQTSARPA